VTDPAFGYYRSLSGGRNWERDLRASYTDRFQGRGERLPRTLSQQNALVKNLATERKNVDLSRVTALRPLAQSSRPEAKLVQVQRDERERQRQGGEQFRKAGVQRAAAEKQIVVRKEAPTKANAAPRSVPLNLPKFERKGGDAPKVGSPRNLPPTLNRPSTDRPAPKIERPPQRIEPPKVEKSQPKFERSAPRIEQPKFERPAPRFEPPKIEKPREQPRIERSVPRPTPQPQVRPAPQPAPQIRSVPQQSRPMPQNRPAPQQFRPAPQQSRPVQQVRPAPQQSRPAPQVRPSAKPQKAPSRPAQSKPQGGKPRR
jgi:hypothetical protein